ncbi:tyrosine-type recombinase/integrase [Cohnella thermotolerans]|uniref:tyrosine-type recombinase/integrase n=1 Tax=Cohnella thermotolerans TaxID=329858 RepID=UPI000422F4FD|nr:tyrosine-type recombinase/integrase [Cohnella thermotolerans]
MLTEEPATRELSLEAYSAEDDDSRIVRMFLASCNLSANTIRNYYRAIERFRAFVSYKPLAKVTWREIEAFKACLIKGGYSYSTLPLAPASVAAYIAPLKSLYKWGSDANIGLFPYNPTTSIRLPQVPVTSRRRYLTRGEVGKLLQCLKMQGQRNYLIGLSLVLLGTRVSELVAIRFGDFYPDPDERGIWLSIKGGKGGKNREIKVPSQLWELFESYAHHLAKGGSPSPDLRLFPLSTRQIERIISDAGERSAIRKKLSPHWLRHTNATLALLNGASLQQVQETLGHSHINTTQRYLHTVEQLNKTAPDFVQEYLHEYIVN